MQMVPCFARPNNWGLAVRFAGRRDQIKSTTMQPPGKVRVSAGQGVSIRFCNTIDRPNVAMREGNGSSPTAPFNTTLCNDHPINGLVAYLCRSECWFRPRGVQRPKDFSLPMLNVGGVEYKSRRRIALPGNGLCANHERGRWLSLPVWVSPGFSFGSARR